MTGMTTSYTAQFLAFFMFTAATTTAAAFCPQSHSRTTTTSNTRLSFFQDLKKAFENDAAFEGDDKRSGQIDEGQEQDARTAAVNALTPTQQKWRSQQEEKQSMKITEKKTLSLDLYLTGVPNKDPSNDLFGSKVNISGRDRRVNLNVPDTPTVTDVRCNLQTDGRLTVQEPQEASGFLTEELTGDWVASEPAGDQLRFRFPVAGYERRVETKGTIQNVFWTDQEEQSSETSTVYSIPAGWLYGEADVVSSRNNGDLVLENCVLKIEQSVGFLGVASKMIPCGTFTARTISSPSSPATTAPVSTIVSTTVPSAVEVE